MGIMDRNSERISIRWAMVWWWFRAARYEWMMGRTGSVSRRKLRASAWVWRQRRLPGPGSEMRICCPAVLVWLGFELGGGPVGWVGLFSRICLLEILNCPIFS